MVDPRFGGRSPRRDTRVPHRHQQPLGGVEQGFATVAVNRWGNLSFAGRSAQRWPTLAKVTRRRDSAFREKVLLAYEYRYAVCVYDGQLQREAVGLDAAHIRWWAADGPDEVSNGIAACSFHHKLLDRGAIGLPVDHKLTVSTHFLGRSAMAETLVLSFVDRPLLAPQPGQPLPHVHHVAWH